MKTFFILMLALVPLQAQQLINPYSFAASSTLNNGLLAYWKLDESNAGGPGSFVVREDSGPNNRDLDDWGPVASTTGKIGNALDLETGENDRMVIQNTFASSTGDFTVSVWVNQESYVGGATHGTGIVAAMNGETAGDWAVAVNGQGGNGSVIFYHWSTSGNDADGRRYTASGMAPTGSWAHIVCRFSSGTYTVWVGGVSRSLTTDSTGSGYTSEDFTLGAFGVGLPFYDGAMDELAIWSRALTDDEIAELYAAGAGKTCCPF